MRGGKERQGKERKGKEQRRGGEEEERRGGEEERGGEGVCAVAVDPFPHPFPPLTHTSNTHRVTAPSASMKVWSCTGGETRRRDPPMHRKRQQGARIRRRRKSWIEEPPSRGSSQP